MMLLAWLNNPSFSDWNNDVSKKSPKQEIVDTFSENPKINEKNTVSSQQFLEVLQWDIKKQIIEWAVYYFQHDVTFEVKQEEIDQLKKDLEKYLSKNPGVISLNWNKLVRKMDKNQFKNLFKVLLPYFRKGGALNNNPAPSRVILGYIEDFAWLEEAEFDYFYYFWRFFMETAKQTNWRVTIGEFITKMMEVLPNQKIIAKINSWGYNDIRNLDIRELGNSTLINRFKKK